MSTVDPSASFLPFAISGSTFVSPPVPVPGSTVPVPVFWNHVSSVKEDAPSPGAAPNVTYWLVPLNWSAWLPAA